MSHRLAAVAPIGPLAWEPPYAVSAALKRQKKKKKKKSYQALNKKVMSSNQVIPHLEMILNKINIYKGVHDSVIYTRGEPGST